MNLGRILLTLAAFPLAAQARPPPLLDPVIVSASLAPARLSDAHASVSIISREEIEASGFFFAHDLLRALPGLSLVSTGPVGGQSSVFLRGHDSAHTLVMLDGVPLNRESGLAYDFAHFTLNDVERIEIIRGPQSVVHGAGAIGGVVNLVSRIPRQERNFTFEAGSFTSRSGQVYFAGGKKLRMSASAGFYQSDNIDISTDGADEKDGYRNYRASLKMERDTAYGRFSLTGRYRDAHTAIDDERAGRTLDGDPENFNQDVEWVGQGEWSLRTGAFRHRVKMALVDGAFESLGAFGPYAADFSRRQGEYRLGWQQENLSLTTLAGYQFEKAGSTYGRAMEEEHFFAAGEMRWGGGDSPDEGNPWRNFFGLDLNISLRAEFGGRQDDSFVWRSSLGRDFGALRAYIGYGTAIYDPTLSQRYGSFGANPDLARGVSAGWEAGLAWQDESGLSANFAWFDERLEDKITYDAADGYYNEPGVSRREGAELSFIIPLSDHFSAGLDVSQIRTHNAAGEAELRRPQQQARIRFLWAEGPWTLNFILNARGASPDRNEVRLKPYQILSLHAAWKMDRQITFFLRGENILNESYQDVYSYNTRGAGLFFGLRASY